MASKAEIRSEIRTKRGALVPAEITAASAQVLSRLCNLPCWLEARVVLLYAALPTEVSTLPLLNSDDLGKTLLLPVVCGNELKLRVYTNESALVVGSFGVLEPQGDFFIDYGLIDLVVVPGVAFDRLGNRLGYGKGFYDRLLPKLSALRLAVCFDFQLYDNILVDQYDEPMNIIVTQTEIIFI